MSRRLKVPEGEVGYYHAMSRVAGQQSLLGSVEKEVFRRMMWRVAEFSGVTIVTYALMNNHFHVVVRIPEPMEISDEELVRRYGALYPKPTPWNPVTAERLRGILAAGGDPAREWRRSLQRRMHDVSWFMRTLKQRFSRWFNATHERKGTLWSERFKTVLIEEGRALLTVCAYVDLNAVRAGTVKDPKDYRFCGYAEACAGNREARRGLALAERDLKNYRMVLYGTGSAPREEKEWIDRDAALKVIEKQQGNLPLWALLRLRVRYMSQSRVLGRKEFVLRMGTKSAGTRAPRAVDLQGGNWGGITSLGGMRKDLFG